MKERTDRHSTGAVYHDDTLGEDSRHCCSSSIPCITFDLQSAALSLPARPALRPVGECSWSYGSVNPKNLGTNTCNFRDPPTNASLPSRREARPGLLLLKRLPSPLHGLLHAPGAPYAV